METENEKPKKPWSRALAACLMSFVVDGLGQMYNGQLAKGLFFAALSVASVLAFYLSHAGQSYASLLGWALGMLALQLFVAGEALVTVLRGRDERGRYRFRQLAVYAVAVAFASIGLQGWVNAHGVEAYKIPSASMQETLMEDDQVMVWADAYKASAPERGDVVIFAAPPDPTKDFIKRVVGLPGDVVEVRGKRLVRNGQIVDEPHARHTDPAMLATERDHFGPVTVPEANYFVMGDNRDASFDSRFWGFVPRGALKGKVLYVYWADDWGRIGEPVE